MYMCVHHHSICSLGWVTSIVCTYLPWGRNPWNRHISHWSRQTHSTRHIQCIYLTRHNLHSLRWFHGRRCMTSCWKQSHSLSYTCHIGCYCLLDYSTDNSRQQSHMINKSYQESDSSWDCNCKRWLLSQWQNDWGYRTLRSRVHFSTRCSQLWWHYRTHSNSCRQSALFHSHMHTISHPLAQDRTSFLLNTPYRSSHSHIHCNLKPYTICTCRYTRCILTNICTYPQLQSSDWKYRILSIRGHPLMSIEHMHV